MTMNRMISVSNVSLICDEKYYFHGSLKNTFIKLVRNPFSFVEQKSEKLTVLDKISIDILEGERVAILGRNGSGKSSLCRCISGIYKPTSGTIFSAGKITAVFDTAAAVQPELTGRENAEILACLLFRGENFQDPIAEALDFSELGSHLDRPIKNYSVGMLTRLVLSIVSMKPSEILILDEVFIGADLNFQRKMKERMLKNILRSRCTLFVSHDLDAVEECCNRAIIMKAGSIVFSGDVDLAVKLFRQNSY